MAHVRWILIGAAAASGATLAAWSVRKARDVANDDDGRWHTVSVLRSQEDVLSDDGFAAPLRELGDAIDVRLREAPGNRGVELSARWIREAEPGELPKSDRSGAIRTALRQSKQLIEAGEIPTTEGQPAGHRSATPTGLITDLVASKANAKGVS